VDGKAEPFGVDVVYLPQVWKTICGLEIEDMDLFFMHEDKISKFCDSIFEGHKNTLKSTKPFVSMIDRMSPEQRVDLREKFDRLRQKFHEKKMGRKKN
jgi:hypothetical protein